MLFVNMLRREAYAADVCDYGTTVTTIGFNFD